LSKTSNCLIGVKFKVNISDLSYNLFLLLEILAVREKVSCKKA
jgi:hypothetical protein